MEKNPCKVFYPQDGEVIEETWTLHHDYEYTANTLYVRRRVEKSEATRVVRPDLLARFKLE